MEKTVIIGGVSRTGKSILANRLWFDTKSTVFHADHLTGALANNFPDKFSLHGNLETYSALELILKKIIRNMGKEFGYLRIFETSVLQPHSSMKLFPHDHFVKIYLGYPSIDPMIKLKQIRNFATAYPHCWSHHMTDKEVLNFIKNFIEKSKVLQLECKNLGIRFIDTSCNIETRLYEALKYLHEKLGVNK